MAVPYSAEKDDLYHPSKRAAFFPQGRPKSEAALCVEMARLAYTRPDSGFTFDRPRMRKVLAGIGFTDCQFFESANHPDGRGSHGFLALDKAANLAVLSFRGTDADDPTDLGDDIDVIPQKWGTAGKVHSGFAGALMELWVGDEGAEAALRQNNGYEVLFTGHSLGAAMATLAASLRLPKALYTFGCPRAGNRDFVDALVAKNIKSYRYVDCCDLVARVPPESFGYVHLGDSYYIDRDRAVKERSESDPYIGEDRGKAEIEYLEKYAWRIGDVGFRPLADHAPVNYVWPVTAATP